MVIHYFKISQDLKHLVLAQRTAPSSNTIARESQMQCIMVTCVCSLPFYCVPGSVLHRCEGTKKDGSSGTEHYYPLLSIAHSYVPLITSRQQPVYQWKQSINVHSANRKGHIILSNKSLPTMTM